MTDRSEAFREDVRFKLLRMLERHPEYTQRDIAQSLGVSLGGVNYCLNALIDKGHIKVANFRQSDRKLRYAYVLTPSGIAERALLTSKFLQRKMREYELIRAEIDALIDEGVAGPDAKNLIRAPDRAGTSD